MFVYEGNEHLKAFYDFKFYIFYNLSDFFCYVIP